jgi:hypothetical protein
MQRRRTGLIAVAFLLLAAACGSDGASPESAARSGTGTGRPPPTCALSRACTQHEECCRRPPRRVSARSDRCGRSRVRLCVCYGSSTVSTT